MMTARYFAACYMGSAPSVREAVAGSFRDALPAARVAEICAEWAGRPLLVRDLEARGAILAITPPLPGEVGACGVYYLFGTGFEDAADAQELACDLADENHAGRGPFGSNPWAVYRV